MIGRTVGRYRIVAKLGEGGMGSVWKAEDALLGRSVALKFLSRDMANSTGARKRFLREAQAASRLDHPGIGTIYDVGEVDGEVFIALRLIDGETIRDRLARRGSLDLREAVDIALAAADALAHAHARGILHRDISSRNLMLTRDGQVVVVDFGLALHEEATRMTQSGVTMGTVAYMAPEVVQGQHSDRRSDIYALGVVLYEMLTGRVPFRGDRTAAMLYAIVHDEPESPCHLRPETPADLEQSVLKALSKDPQARPQSMEEFLTALDNLRGGLPTSSSPAAGEVRVVPQRRTPTVPSASDSLSPTMTLEPAAGVGIHGEKSRRRWLLLGAGTLVSVGLIVGIITWVPHLRRQETPAAPTANYQSVAVLPLRNMSANPAASEHLTEGLSQALITKLTQMSGLRVTPWMTSRRFHDSEEPVDKLVQEFHVDALLVGSFQQQGDRISGTVSLIDGKTGFQVWAEDFDEPRSDLFGIENRIAMGAATGLLGKVTGEQAEVLAKPSGRDVEAQETYYKGLRASQKGDAASLDEAVQLFEAAVARDPELAVAHVGIGSVRTDRYFHGWGGLKDLEAAEAHFRRALEIDPSLLSARRGLIHVFWEKGQSEECLKQGKIVADSRATGIEALLARADAYFFGGLFDRALPILQQVMEQDPGNPGAPWLMTVAASWSGRHQEAVKVGERYLKRFGDDYEIHLWIAFSYQRLGDLEKAAQHYDRMLATIPAVTARYQQLYAAAFFRKIGQVDKADRILLDGLEIVEQNLEKFPDNPKIRDDLANYYGLLGDLKRRQEEEARLLKDFPVNGVPPAELAEGAAFQGDTRHAIELTRLALKRGGMSAPWREFIAVSGAKDLSLVPGYRELLAEDAARLSRLESLY